MKNKLSLAFVLLFIAHSGFAQSGNALKVTEKQKAEIIDTLLKKIQELYIFPETAIRIEQEIKQRQKKGVYKKITDAKILADTLTHQLVEISHDKHFGVSFRENPIPVPAVADAPSAEQNEEMRRFAISVNFGFKKLEILEGNIGYLRIDGFIPAEEGAETAIAAMNYLANTDALIFDVRNNGGGHNSMINLLLTYLFKESVHVSDMYWRNGNKTNEQWTLPYVPGKKYLDKPVYVLTSKETISAGEEFAYDLQAKKRATIVGEVTAGAANPGWDIRLNDHFEVFIPQGHALNPITKTNWEGTGVQPDIAAPQEQALTMAQKAALKKLAATEKNAKARKYLNDLLQELEKK